MKILRLVALAAAGFLACMPAAAQRLSAFPAGGAVSATDTMIGQQPSLCASTTTACNGVQISAAQLSAFILPGGVAPLATKLASARTINGVPFDGSAPITINAVDSTSRLAAGANLSELGSVSAARSNLGLVIGTTIETWSANLDALAALTGTNTIYYRSGANTWSPIVLGPNLAFSGGNLTIPGLPITLSGDAAGGTIAGSGALALTLATVNTTPGSYGGALTIPTITTNGKGLITASGSVALGTVPIGQGGTGSTTASGARSALGASASGPNNDITSLSGLTTALSIGQGGTGGTTAATARSGIGAAASGANTDITSIAGSAATLTMGRTFAFTGDFTCTTAAFNGSANLSTACALANTATARTNLGVSATGADPNYCLLTGCTFTGGISGTSARFTGSATFGGATLGTSAQIEITGPSFAYFILNDATASTGRRYAFGSGFISPGTFGVFDYTAGKTVFVVDSTLAIKPGADATQTLGVSGVRWANVYAAASTVTGTSATGILQLTASSTVANLPTCNAAARGTRTYVTDATAPAFLGTLTGGGSVVSPAFCNGSGWVAG